MATRRRKFYGWGYEGDTVSDAEVAEFERAWTKLLGVDSFVPIPFPTESEIELRSSRVSIPASLTAFCTGDRYDRLDLDPAACPHGWIALQRIWRPGAGEADPGLVCTAG